MSRKAQAVRILIADDHPIFRDGLRSLLEVDPQFVVVGEACDGQEAIESTLRLIPDILLLDLSMPRLHGMETLRKLGTAGTPVRIIVLTAEIQKPQILEALLLGASGLITKDTPTDLFFKAIRTVMKGQYWIARESVTDVIQVLRDLSSSGRNDRRKDNFGLTHRELEIVRAVAAGEANKDTAKRLCISDQTVKHHLTSIFSKVGVSKRLELALFALTHNLIEADATGLPKTVVTDPASRSSGETEVAGAAISRSFLRLVGRD